MMKSGCPHIHPEHGLFDGGRRGDHLFIHHGSKLLYPHVLPLRTQLLNTRSHQRCKIVVLSGLVGSRTERASPLPERGCAGRCSAPPTGLLPGDCSETSGPSVTEGGCWRSRGSCRLNLRERERGSEAGGSVNRWFGTLSDDLQDGVCECEAHTVGLVGGSRVRRGRRVDQRVGGEVGELRHRSQQTARV